MTDLPEAQYAARVRDARMQLLSAQQQFKDGLKAVQRALATLEVCEDGLLGQSAIGSMRHQKDGRRRLSKIEQYPELEAFIRGHIETNTFGQIVALVADEFPPEMHTSESALSRWWRKQNGDD